MIKKKAAKSGAGPKKIAKKRKKKGSNKSKKETNPAGVRKEVSRMVKSGAMKMARAVIDEGKGQLATMRYLFEVASIFPPEANTDHIDPEEECLAKTLLRRLNIPEEPIKRDEDEETESPEEKSGMPAVSSGGAGSGGAEKNSGAERNEEGKEAVLARIAAGDSKRETRSLQSAENSVQLHREPKP
jgi:hypothetical protein